MNQASLSLVVLKTRNLEACRSFYERLGISFVREQHGRGPTHYAGSLQTLVLEIYPASEAEAGAESANTGVMLGFEVESVRKTAERLAALTDVQMDALKSLPQPRFTISDPDGQKVLLYERKS